MEIEQIELFLGLIDLFVRVADADIKLAARNPTYSLLS